MAIERNSAKSTLKIKVAVGAGANGSVTYGVRTITDMNPELTDEDMLAIGQEVGTLQTYAVSGVVRTDSATLETA